ncbi:hypothetical protein ACCO45_009596 [Purpureocillium lilacinum]|uniref:Uncharacterized protein n=1 Tax=Purpureocillium lilacinum TaxID=33203 RepID=A0ACC4DN40_PURLI
MKPWAIILVASAALAAAKPTVYLIRHGEKPADGGDGLSEKGKQRAQCLRQVFGAGSPYNIGYIMVQTPKADLGIKIDLSCDRDDTECVQDVVDGYKGNGNILICGLGWLGAQDAQQHRRGAGRQKVDNYPDGNFNLIWTQPAPYTKIVKVSSEACPGLDN